MTESPEVSEIKNGMHSLRSTEDAVAYSTRSSAASNALNVNTFNEICRTCLSRTNLRSLFIAAEVDSSMTIQEMLGTCFSIQVRKKDKTLPSNICSNCVSELSRAFTFRKQCFAVQETLSHSLKVAEKAASKAEDPHMMFISTLKIEDSIPVEIPDPGLGNTDVIDERYDDIKDDNYNFDDDDDDDDDDYDAGVANDDDDYRADMDNDVLSDDAEKSSDEDKVVEVKARKVRRKRRKTRASASATTMTTVQDEDDIPLALRTAKKVKVKRERLVLATPDDNAWKCLECDCVLDTRQDLTTHAKKKNHEGIQKYECQRCCKLVTVYSLLPHLRSHTQQRPYVCKLCGRAYTLRENLKRHMRAHTNDQPYKCDVCGKGYNRALTRDNHRRHHYGNYVQLRRPQRESPLYKCDICGRDFKRMRWFKYHLKTHHSNANNVDAPSNNTDNAAVSSDQLSASVKAEPVTRGKTGPVPIDDGPDDPNAPREKFPCSICGNTYKSKLYLRMHIQMHGEKTFLCSECGKSFVTKALLQSHLKVHTGEKPHKCTVCNKAFAQLGTLQSHVLIHTGEKPYKCNICGKAFTQKCHLVLHLRTHTGEKPYTCSYCGKAFAVKGTLTVHLRIHTGETPHMCPECGKGFYDTSSLKKHRRSHASSGLGPAPSKSKSNKKANKTEQLAAGVAVEPMPQQQPLQLPPAPPLQQETQPQPPPHLIDQSQLQNSIQNQNTIQNQNPIQNQNQMPNHQGGGTEEIARMLSAYPHQQHALAIRQHLQQSTQIGCGLNYSLVQR